MKSDSALRAEFRRGPNFAPGRSSKLRISPPESRTSPPGRSGEVRVPTPPGGRSWSLEGEVGNPELRHFDLRTSPWGGAGVWRSKLGSPNFATSPSQLRPGAEGGEVQILEPGAKLSSPPRTPPRGPRGEVREAEGEVREAEGEVRDAEGEVRTSTRA